MKGLSFFSVAVFLMIGCQSGPVVVEEISEEQKAYTQNPSPTSGAAYIQAIVDYVQRNPSLNQQDKVELFNTAFEISKEQKAWNQAAGLVNTLLKEAPEATEHKSWAEELIELTAKSNNPEALISLKLAYAKAYPNDEKSESYSAIKGPIDSRITQLGASMFNDSTHQFNQSKATQFIDACEAYALILPSDAKALDYLHKAGETARSIKSFRKAISIYDWIYRFYPQDDRSSQALFLQAFTYDNDLRDLEKSKELYSEYLDKYPNEDFADDTQFLLKNLGKSDEEILKELGQNN